MCQPCTVCGTGSAVYNTKGETRALFCSNCKQENMVNVVSKKCQTCQKKSPTFNKMGEVIPIYCYDCKEVDMIDVKHKKCIKCNITRPTFNNEGSSVALYCFKCKEDDMTDVAHRKCITCRKKAPNFNIESEIKPLYCYDCKSDNMIDIYHKKCIKCNVKRASFNAVGNTTALYCYGCRDLDMIDTSHKKCQGCNTIRPSFNCQGQTVGIFCSACKEPDMVNVVDKMCISCQKKRPTFNETGEVVPLYCVDCKKNGMVNIKDDKCHCGTIARFGAPGQKATLCRKHKEPNMVIHPRRGCSIKNCKLQALYGIISPVRCELHKEASDYNLLLKECIKCKNVEVCNEEGVCYEYCVNTEKYTLRRKVWESHITAVLAKTIKRRFHSLDLPLNFSCNTKRPDIVYDCESFFVIVEVDEKQHKAYGDQCETNRMIMIAQAAGVPVIFIRYNPDSYLLPNGKKSDISDSKRQRKLVSAVRELFYRPALSTAEYIRVVYLFYDGFDSNNDDSLEFETIPLPIGFFDYKIVQDPSRKKRKLDIQITDNQPTKHMRDHITVQ